MPDSALPGKSVDKKWGKYQATKVGKSDIEVLPIPIIDEMNSEFLIALTRIRDAVAFSSDVDSELVCQINQQVSLIRRNASRCIVEEGVCNEWIRGLKRYLHTKDESGFRNAQLQDLYKLLVRIESDMRNPPNKKNKRWWIIDESTDDQE